MDAAGRRGSAAGRTVSALPLRTRRLLFHAATVLGLCLLVVASLLLGPHYHETVETDERYFDPAWEVRYVVFFALAGGLVGVAHLTLAQLPVAARTSRRTRKPGQKRPARLVPGWFLLLYPVLHLAVAGVCAWLAPTTSPASPSPTGDYRTDAFLGALFFAPLGYVGLPIVIMLAGVLAVLLPALAVVLVVGLIVAARGLLTSGRPTRERLHDAAGNLVLAGLAGTVMFSLVALLASVSFGSSFHGGRGAGLAALTATVLVGLGLFKVGGASLAFLVIARAAAACAVVLAVGGVLGPLTRPRTGRAT